MNTEVSAGQGEREQLDALIKRLRGVGYTLDAAEVLLSTGRSDESSFARGIGVIEGARRSLDDLRDALAAMETANSSLRRCG